MSQPWQPEREVSPELAAQLIDEQFPHLAPARIELLGVGWDNIAFVVNDNYVFRFPRRKLGAELMLNEMRLMPAIAPRLPIRVPDNELQGKPCDAFGWAFAGYRMIGGVTGCRANLTDSQRHAIARPLGEFLSTLHRIPIDFARDHGGTGDPMGRLNVPKRQAQTRDRLAYIAKHGLVESIEALSAITESAPRDYAARADTLVHGDLYSRHLIFDAASRALCGVIDFGDIHIGDRATDLMIAWTFLPPAVREVFFAAYGPVDDLTLKMSRFRAVNHAACVTAYAHEVGDAELLRECLGALIFAPSPSGRGPG